MRSRRSGPSSPTSLLARPISQTREISYQKYRGHFIHLGRTCGYRKKLQFYGLHRGSGKMLNGLGVREAMDTVVQEVRGREKEFWISCVFPGEGNVLPDGSSVEKAVRAMVEKKDGVATPARVGINCAPVGEVEELTVEFEKAVRRMVDSSGVDRWPDLELYPDATDGEV
ncbi:hypothetical protein OIDMADRAFT_54161 [Oidiodendron maius Zn]|uniref:Hcy-binding domain-containing protein n=1 Tax=Oidiodendron maius (strain Zn) TaxID=913774 RepID=A0A0C3CPQ9_OIDMZ|nr:hypothetical protein OIDMADRAFT_54161 [Oidiodendron maius Zn]